MTGRKTAAFVLAAAGVALGVQTARFEMARSTGERSAGAAATAAQEARARLDVERHRLELGVVAAAQVKPLLAALDNNVDGQTLVDLFQSEDWWNDIRRDYPVTRVVVGSQVLATTGSPDPGTSDRDVVMEARKKPVASAVVSINGQSMFVVASKLAALTDRAPVLVLAKPVDPALLAIPVQAAALPPRGPADLGVAGASAVLVLAALALLFFGGSGRAGDFVTPPGQTARENTLRFVSTAQKQHAPHFDGPSRDAGRARPMASHSAPVMPAVAPVNPSSPVIAVNPAFAPAPVAVLTTPAPVGPPRRPTAPDGVPVGENGAPGQTFGRYHLLDRLGQGGMADVFTAVAHGVEGFSRVFVLKRLRPELCQDKEAIAQFVDEARMQSNLVHSNIVPVFDFGRVANEYFMTQEYIVGRDLVRLIARYYEHAQRTITPRLAYYIAHETLQALQYAHTKRDREGHALGIVHRDVSAGNIIMSAQGEVKLADFGIVKSNRRTSKTQMGMVKGNANFMSPEQARGHTVDARADLFSVALVLYYCLTNKLFYDGDNDLDVLYKAATGPTPEDFDAIRRLPSPASDVLGRALAPDPADRFQSAAEFADVLAPHVGGAKAEAARLMQTLFGDELRREAA